MSHPKTSETSQTEDNLYELTQKQLQKALEFSKIPDSFALLLSQPKNEIIVNFCVKLDDGSTKMFKGYRVQHNNILGPYKGGLRFHQGVYLDECKALSCWMTLKCSLQKLPFGGGKGGIKFNPRLHSKSELERISKGFCRSLFQYIGQDTDIPAPDLGTNSQTMDWMTHMYQNLANTHLCGTFTGKSPACGGSEGREEATGTGVVHCLKEWALENNVELVGKTFIMQGFGNVGSFTAILLSQLGMSCLAVGDHSGYRRSVEGFNPYRLKNYVVEHGSIEDYPTGEEITRDQFFETECDVLIPAALELQIRDKEAHAIKAKLVLEAANGPTTTEADEILQERGIQVIPDLMANSGGVVVSYYEWLQNRRFEYLKKSEILNKLEKQMSDTYRTVSATAKDKNITLRMAAHLLSIEHLYEVYSRKRTQDNDISSYDV